MLEDEDQIHLMSIDEDEEEQCIRLLSFCKKHKQPSNDRPTVDERLVKNDGQHLSYCPPINALGCARCESYDYSGRRGRTEPEVLTTASVKHLYVENIPYLVGVYCRRDPVSHASAKDKVLMGSKFSHGIHNGVSDQEASHSILSMADKYRYKRETIRNRLAFDGVRT